MPESALRLHVLVANERDDRLDAITRMVEGLGHDIVARALEPEEVAPLSRRLLPDVALVGLGTDPTHALAMITHIVKEAACPVIALLDGRDPDYVDEASKRGIFAYVIIDAGPGELRNALDITLRRFAEFRNLEGAFGRRAIIEQAKGILMARESIDADAAYQILKSESQRTGTKLSDLARAVTETHLLLRGKPESNEQS
jgi:two-component system, response regulator / RNA-binding antiterminator